jgi:hypothetical protein
MCKHRSASFLISAREEVLDLILPQGTPSQMYSQDFSKILVVLGLQNSGGGWYPYKANDKINRVKPFKLEFAKILSSIYFLGGEEARDALAQIATCRA